MTLKVFFDTSDEVELNERDVDYFEASLINELIDSFDIRPEDLSVEVNMDNVSVILENVDTPEELCSEVSKLSSKKFNENFGCKLVVDYHSFD